MKAFFRCVLSLHYCMFGIDPGSCSKDTSESFRLLGVLLNVFELSIPMDLGLNLYFI